MAQYKVPQDVEADDKLLGPFSFRQFVYLMIAGGLIALAVGLFQLVPVLAIIPLPPVFLLLALALPLKKDQPMETYLAALVSYYLKPHKRVWTPGQRESTIEIAAPKNVEESRARDISGEEATHRLSFLADIVDTGGYAIKGAGMNSVREEVAAEANAAVDIFETVRFDTLEDAIARDENERHKEVIDEMRQVIKKNDNIDMGEDGLIHRHFEEPERKQPSMSDGISAEENTRGNLDNNAKNDVFDSDVVVKPGSPVEEKRMEKTNVVNQENDKKDIPKPPKPSIIELANNNDFSVATIAKEANRIKERDEGEVFISLH